jgi:hypothetical protein
MLTPANDSDERIDHSGAKEEIYHERDLPIVLRDWINSYKRFNQHSPHDNGFSTSECLDIDRVIVAK